MASNIKNKQRISSVKVGSNSRNFTGFQNGPDYGSVQQYSSNLFQGETSLNHPQFNLFNLNADSSWHQTNPRPQGPFCWNVPKCVTPHFIGRERVLAQVKKGLVSSKVGPRVYVITGMAGIGKSEVCLRLVEEMTKHDKSALENDLQDLARKLFANPPTDDVKEFLKTLGEINEKWLMIFDNASDPDLSYKQYFPPAGSQGTVLLNSRNPEARGRYGTTGSSDLTPLDLGDGVELLYRTANLSATDQDSQRNAAKEIVDHLQSHTLALIHAGKYIAQESCGIDQYLRLYKEQRKKISQFIPQLVENDYCHVYATFDTSVHNFRTTENQSSTAADALSLLEVLSMFHFTGLPMDIFREAWEGSRNVILCASSLGSDFVQLSKVEYLEKGHIDQVSNFFTVPPTDWEFACRRLKKALRLLEQHALIIIRGAAGDNNAKLISMHPLVHSWAKDRLDKSCQQNAFLVAVTLIALSTESSPEREPFYSKTWLDYEGQLRQHIESIVENERITDLSPFPSSLTSKNSYRCARILATMGKHELLKTYLAHIFTRLKLDLENPSCPEVLRFYKERACNLANLRELKLSLELWEKVKLTEATLPEHDTERILSLQGVAGAYLANEECAKAIPLLQDVQRILKGRLPGRERDWVKSSVELARAHLKAGDGASAIGCLEHISCVNLDTLDDDDPVILYLTHMLARAYLQTSETGKAIALFEEVLQLQKAAKPPYFPGILATQSWLARTYSKAGRFENAATVLSEMVQTMKGQAPDYNKQILVAENQLNVALNSIPYGRRTSMCLVSSIKASVNIASRILFRKPLDPPEDHKPRSIALRSNNRSWTFVSWSES